MTEEQEAFFAYLLTAAVVCCWMVAGAFCFLALALERGTP